MNSLKKVGMVKWGSCGPLGTWTFSSQRVSSSFLEVCHVSVPDETHLLAASWRYTFSLVKECLSKWRKAAPHLAHLFIYMKQCNLDLYHVPTWTCEKSFLSYLGKNSFSWEAINLEKCIWSGEWLCTSPGLFSCQSVTEGQNMSQRRSYAILVTLCL